MNAFLLAFVVAAAAATVAHAVPCDLNGRMLFTIGSAEDFGRFGDAIFLSNARVILSGNIDFSRNTSFPLGGQGSSCKPFVGILDGNGYTISGLKATRSDASPDSALFCMLKGACVRNLVFDETCSFVGNNAAALSLAMEGDNVITNVVSKATVSGTTVAGGLVAKGNFAEACNSELNSCTVSGTVNSSATVGGLIGLVGGESNAALTLRNCTSTGLVQTQSDVAGGFLGEIVTTLDFNVQISESTRSGLINTTNAQAVGGFVGGIYEVENVNLTITDSVQDGTISAVYESDAMSSVGGFVGIVMAQNTGLVISRSSNSGDITTQSKTRTDAGGFVGSYYSFSNSRVDLDFCTNNGRISVQAGVKDATAGGLVGVFNLESDTLNSVSVSNCENSGVVNGSPNGTASGFFSAVGSTEGRFTGSIYNSVNKGRIVGAQAFGIASDVTSARLVVSMGTVEGSAKARMFWNNTASGSVSQLYMLDDSNRANDVKATVFSLNQNNMFYFPVSNMEGSSLENILQNVVIKDARQGGRWTSNIGMTNKPAFISVHVFFGDDSKKKPSNPEPISSFTWIVKSGENLNTVLPLRSFFSNDKCIVVPTDSQNVLVSATTVAVNDTSFDVQNGFLVTFRVVPPEKGQRLNATFDPRDGPEYTKESILEELKEYFPKCAHYKVTPDAENSRVFDIQLTTTEEEGKRILDILAGCSHPEIESIF